jgi:hypothetical protein
MKYPDTKIESACAIKDKRGDLNQPYYDADASLLVATNGQILAAIPTESTFGSPSVSGSVPLDAIKHVRKTTPRGMNFDPMIDLSDAETARAKGATFTRPTETFPDYQAIIQDKALDTPDICIDAALLKRLSDALQDRTGKDHRINIYLPRNADGTIDNGSQIRVEAAKHPERLGLIMPCRHISPV